MEKQFPSHGYNPKELRELPTVSSSHCCDLKIEGDRTRVWLCRSGGGVTVEALRGGKWGPVAGSCSDRGDA